MFLFSERSSDFSSKITLLSTRYLPKYYLHRLDWKLIVSKSQQGLNIKHICQPKCPKKVHTVSYIIFYIYLLFIQIILMLMFMLYWSNNYVSTGFHLVKLFIFHTIYSIKKSIVIMIKTEYGNFGLSLRFEVTWISFHYFKNRFCIYVCAYACILKFSYVLVLHSSFFVFGDTKVLK